MRRDFRRFMRGASAGESGVGEKAGGVMDMRHKKFDKNYLLQISETLKADWLAASELEPDFLECYTAEEQESREEQIRSVMEKANKGLGEYPQSFFAVRKRKRWKIRMEKMLGEVLREEKALGIGGVMGEEELWEFQACLKEFLRKVRKFDRNLALEDMGQAVRNYMVYAIFLALNGKELKYRPAAFGYSMLYPYTDNYIDSPQRTEREKEHYNRLIEDKLQGKRVKPLSRHEKKTEELLGQIEKDYGRPHEVYEGLLLMLEAQEISLRQEERWKRDRKACREEDVLGVSAYKGGVSVLMDRYFIDRPLTEKDSYFYYGFGFLLQLCDDLQDISQDKEEGNPTVFSLCGTDKEVRGKVNKLLHFAAKIFESCDTENRKFKRFLQKNCYLLILASAAGSGEWMEEEWLSRMQGYLPVRMDYLRKYSNGILGSSKGDGAEKGRNERERRKLMKMLDVLIAD